MTEITMTFFKFVREFVFTDNIQQKVQQFVIVPLGIVTLPFLIVFKFLAIKFRFVFDALWEHLITLYKFLLDVYDNIDKNNELTMSSEITTFLFMGAVLIGLACLMLNFGARHRIEYGETEIDEE